MFPGLPTSKKPTPPPKVLYDKDKYDNLYDWLFEGLSKELATSAEFIQLPLFDVYALWRTIVRKHLQDTPVEFRTALQEMSQTKLQLDEGVEDFASRVKHAVNKLRASTQTLSKEQVFEMMEVSTLTLGVPAEYESSVAVLDEDITFEEATRKLRLTQQRLKARDEEGGGGRRGMALAAQGERHQQHRRPRAGRTTPEECADWMSKVGCKNPTCKWPHDPEKKGVHESMKCYQCGELGHASRARCCPRYAQRPPPPPPAASAHIVLGDSEHAQLLQIASSLKALMQYSKRKCEAPETPAPARASATLYTAKNQAPRGTLTVLDTAATYTLSRTENSLVAGSQQGTNIPIETGNGRTRAKVRGTLKVPGTGGKLQLDTLVVPTLPPRIDNLISGPDLDDRGYYSVYGGGKVTVWDKPPMPTKGSTIILDGLLDQGERLYTIRESNEEHENPCPCETCCPSARAFTMSQVFRAGINDIDLTHQRLGCWATEEILHDLGYKGKLSFCKFCAMGKSHRQPKSKGVKTEPKRAGTHLSIDIIAHKTHATPEGHVTGVLATDRHSKFAMGVPLRRKSDEHIIYAVKKAVTYFDSRSQNKVISITFDSEVVLKDSKAVRALLEEMGIEATFSPPYTHNLNPVERTIQSIERIAQCLRERGGSLPQYWWYDLKQAMFIYNSTPKFNKKVSEEKRSLSNEERLIGRRVTSSTERIHSYLCEVYVHRDDSVRAYGDSFAFRGVNFGNSWDTPGAYEVYNRETKRMITTAHVSKFVESGPTAFPFQAARHPEMALPEATQPLPVAESTQPTLHLSENKQEFDESLENERTHATRSTVELPQTRKPPELLTPSNAREPLVRRPYWPRDFGSATTPPPSLEPETPQEEGVGKQGEEQHDSPLIIGLQPSGEMPTPNNPNPAFATRSRRPSEATMRFPASTTHEYEQQLKYEAATAAKQRAAGEAVPVLEGPKAKALWHLVKRFKKEEREQMLQGDSVNTDTHGQQEEMNRMVSEIAKTFVTWGETREPKHPRAAARSPNAEQWSKGEEEEMTSQDKYETYTIVIRPDGDVRIHQAGFVYKEKLEPDGTIRFKVRWVVKGNTMKKDVDFKETYAPVARVTTIRIVLALAACLGLECEHWDVKVAFLNAQIKEEVYCDLPEGFEATPEEGRQTKKRSLTDGQRKVLRQKYVCKLNRAIYGTPQAGREWYLMLCGLLLEFGFKRVESEHALFVYNGEEGYMVMAVWVDDILPAFTKGPLKDKLFAFFKSKGLQMKDLGEVERICGMRVTRDKLNKTITLDVEEYLRKVAQDHNADTSRTFSTPMDSSLQLTREGGKQPLKVDRTKYLSLLGALMFAGVACRVDLSAAISHLATYMADPREQHMQALQRLLSYATQHASLGLVLGGPNSKVEISGFADADWGANLDFRRSRSGFLFYFCGGLVDYKSWLQKTVATSSVHSEYMSASDAVREGMWLYYTIRDVLAPLGIDLPLPITLHEDNQGCIALSKNPVNHSRNKHIDVKYHYIREQVENGFFILYYIETKKQLADFLTKALNRVAFCRNRDIVMGGLG